MSSQSSSKQNVVETTEFGLQPISPPKTSTRSKTSFDLSDAASNVQMTMNMNDHSADKPVAALLDMVRDKDREIAMLKRKLLKRHYRIRDLQQKLSEQEGSSMQMYSTNTE